MIDVKKLRREIVVSLVAFVIFAATVPFAAQAFGFDVSPPETVMVNSVETQVKAGWWLYWRGGW